MKSKVSYSKLLPLGMVLLALLILSGCNTIPNRRSNTAPSTGSSEQQEVIDELIDELIEESPSNEEGEETDQSDSGVQPAQDYSEFADASELQTINAEISGEEPVSIDGNNITVHYNGFLTDGSKFDSSRDRGNPFTFRLGQGTVIDGWDEGLLGKSVGDVFTLVVPADKGYGAADRPGIPANSTLIFEIEVIDIQ